MPPPKPPSATLRDVDTAALMEQLRATRAAVGKVEIQLRRQSAHRAVLSTFQDEIDEIAGLITGDRTYFHAKANSTRGHGTE